MPVVEREIMKHDAHVKEREDQLRWEGFYYGDNGLSPRVDPSAYQDIADCNPRIGEY